MELGKKLRLLRRKRGLNQSDIASILGVAQSVVSDWERGHASPRMARLKAIARALKTNIQELVG
jgi:transcriptional regulator with XRE-family HTH domain